MTRLGLSEATAERYLERAGIREFDGGFDRVAAEALARQDVAAWIEDCLIKLAAEEVGLNRELSRLESNFRNRGLDPGALYELEVQAG